MLPLPIDEFIPEILKKVEAHSNVILSASPGAGKTTRLPPALLKLTDKRILVLEPRRIAAMAAASRIADEQNWQLGSQVGYKIRFESQMTSDTRLVFLTEALLQKQMVADPLLSDVGIVVIDEFHERSQHVDLAVGLLKELQELSRPDLKIVVMSATLDTEPLLKYFSDSTDIQVPGRIFSLDVRKSRTAQKLRTDFSFIEFVCEQIKKSSGLVKAGEHILVFLPGVGEIERSYDSLSDWARGAGISLHKLHGSLGNEEQKAVLKPSVESKIILSTNVAESSLTIDGTRLVIDSGLARRSTLHAKTGFSKLEIARISKSSAIQRAGRAARQAPGICVQLWTEMDERSMPAHEPAEILRSDLSEALLALAAMDIRDFQNFSWFEKPPGERLQKAENFLKALGALDNENKLTHLGKEIARIPAPPRIAKLLVLAKQRNHLALAVDMAVILSERITPIHSSSGYECDLCEQVEHFRKRRSYQQERLRKSLAQNLRFDGKFPNEDLSAQDVTNIKSLLFEVYKDQLARRRNPNESKALLIGGRGVDLEPKSQVKKSEFFLALQLMEGLSNSDTKVSLACGFSREELINFEDVKNNIIEDEWVEYDSSLEKMMLKKAKSYILKGIGALPLQTPHSVAAPADKISDQLAEVAFSEQESLFKQNENLLNWLQRFAFYQRQKELDLLSDEVWLSFWQQASFGENSLKNVLSKDLVYFIESQLDSSLIKDFHQSAPEIIQVPSGSRLRINYSEESPKLEVRLQEVFGWFETPKIMLGKVPLTLVLLGPHYRPVQVTQDLASFWKNGYTEVKKDLKTRYPKHSWPDDPLTAVAQAKGRPTKA